MADNSIQSKMSNSLKWSSLAEIAAKLIVPITNLILARLLTPEAFGVVASATMVISIADLFSDSGFQKFIIQHDFSDELHLFQSANIAFSSNLTLSMILWAIIALFSDKIAALVGSPGLGIVIIVAAASLPVTSFSSIQSGLFKRIFNFRVLFYSRVIAACVPLVVTVPLALLGFSYWSMIIGTIANNVVVATILTLKSEWRPRLYFNPEGFKEMFSFSIWSLAESVGTWLTSYIGTFIVGGILSQYYLGLYKTTMTTVNGIFAIVTTATTSVLFASLSRLQNDKTEYDKTYVNFIKLVSIIIIPLGFGIFVFKDFVTGILLGSQWDKTIPFVGIYSLMSCFTLVYGQFASEYYRGLGRPQASVITTLLHLVALIPALIYGANLGFLHLSYARSLIKIEQILAYWCVLWICFRFNPLIILKETMKPIISALIMSVVGFLLLRMFNSIWSQIVVIVICIITYFVSYVFICRGKKDVLALIKMFAGKFK